MKNFGRFYGEIFLPWIAGMLPKMAWDIVHSFDREDMLTRSEHIQVLHEKAQESISLRSRWYGDGTSGSLSQRSRVRVEAYDDNFKEPLRSQLSEAGIGF